MFRKYQKVENTEVVSPEGHEVIADTLQRTGNVSAANLTDSERQEMTDALDRLDSEAP